MDFCSAQYQQLSHVMPGSAPGFSRDQSLLNLTQKQFTLEFKYIVLEFDHPQKIYGFDRLYSFLLSSLPTYYNLKIFPGRAKIPLPV